MKKQVVFVFVIIVLFVVSFFGSRSAFAGYIVAWGNNTYGQCYAPGGSVFVAVAGGWYHSLALKSDGSLVVWGWNKYDQCSVPAGNDFVSAAAGGEHSLALKSDGSALVWSDDIREECEVPADNEFAAIAGGWERAFVLVREPAVFLLLGLGTALLIRRG